MVPIKEALTFDDVTLAPNYSEILPSETDTSVSLTKNLKLKIPLLSSAMDTVTESKMAIAIAKAGGIGIIHRNLDIKRQVLEIKKVKKQQKRLLIYNFMTLSGNSNIYIKSKITINFLSCCHRFVFMITINHASADFSRKGIRNS